MITAALSAGLLPRAEQLSREQLLMRPHDEDVLLLLAISLHLQHKLAEAIEVYARLTDMSPDSGVYWGNYATALRESGSLQESAQAYAVAKRVAPDNAGILMNLGLLLLQLRDFVDARETLLEAHALNPDSPYVRIHAARACSLCSDTKANELVKPWRHWLPLNDDELQLELANVLTTLADAEAAQQLLEDITLRSPAHLPTLIQLAALHERMNRLDEAGLLLRKISATQPALDEATRQEIIHQEARLAMRKGDLTDARNMLERTGPRDSCDYAHYFILAEVCDKLGATEDAMRALAIAHARQMEEMKLVSPSSFAPGAPVLPTAQVRVTVAEYRRWPKLQAPDALSSPIFIVGFPRSGTTLLEQMLDAHPTFQSMDERPFFNILSDRLGAYGVDIPQDLGKLSQRDCDELRKDYWSLVCEKVPRNWQTQMVDKNPLNMLWLPMIHRLFPEAKFILALRHPCDVILSCYMQNFRSTALVTACASLERVATAYVMAMEHWLHHVDVFQPHVLVSRYEDLVTDFPRQTRMIARFLGVAEDAPLREFDVHARNKGYIGTPSYTQVIQPVNRAGLNRWGRYRREFELLLPVVEPLLEHWGYSGHPDD
ncbi:sulfotransferase [Rhodanobacter sp. C03]|nr:sulfotransferase [Rhodanobacter sp. C03]